jgi:hypothetical protein
MASRGQWTVVFDDKKIIKQTDDGGIFYKILDNDSFWSDPKWANVWAIQYKDDNHDYNDSVEYRDETPHKSWTDANLGNFRTQFVDKWDAIHLTTLQAQWDNDNVDDETAEQKVTRLGARPTSYQSYSS